jgi:hypothetical protein
MKPIAGIVDGFYDMGEGELFWPDRRTILAVED